MALTNPAVAARLQRAVEREVATRVQGSPFLYQQQPKANVPIVVVDRQQVVLGQRLGHGNFAEVVEVTIRQPQQASSSSLCSPKGNTSSGTAGTSVLSAVRHHYQPQLQPPPHHHSPPPQKKTYALKRVLPTQEEQQNKYQDHDRNWIKAAVDLAMEAKYLSCMDHPNIITARGLSSCGATSFLLMDKLIETLDKRILRWKKRGQDDLQEVSCCCCRRRRLQEIASYALQMANAISYVHSFRIILRDVKTANIGFLSSSTTSNCPEEEDDDRRIQLFDFGLCRELPFMAAHGSGPNASYRMSMVGTEGYMAPEIMTARCYGLNADVYSWAMVLYEMVTLEPPQEGRRPTFPDTTPKSLCHLIQKAGAHNVSERCSIKEAAEQLQFLVDSDWNLKAQPEGVHEVSHHSSPCRRSSCRDQGADYDEMSSPHRQEQAMTKTTATCA